MLQDKLQIFLLQSCMADTRQNKIYHMNAKASLLRYRVKILFCFNYLQLFYTSFKKIIQIWYNQHFFGLTIIYKMICVQRRKWLNMPLSINVCRTVIHFYDDYTDTDWLFYRCIVRKLKPVCMTSSSVIMDLFIPFFF